MWQTSTKLSQHSTMSINLKTYFPYAKDALLVPVYKVLNLPDDKLILSHFLAQLAYESDGFKTVEEYASGKAYEGRKDLGNTRPGWGVLYKGRGYVQCTGRTNYQAAALDLKLDLLNHPELLLQPDYAMLVSQWYWNKHNLDAKALKDDLKGITKAINGGTKGYSGRARCLKIFKKILGV